MAIYHGHGQIIGRSGGRSAVACAAYRSASKLEESITDKETGLIISQVWDYSKKLGVVHSKIYAPDNAPNWLYDREQLWNEITKGEKRKDSQLAREFDIALPVELTEEQNLDLLEEIVKECFVKHGMIADANLHLDNPENPHFHVMLSMRDLVEKDGVIVFGLKNESWNKKEFLLNVRKQIADLTNKHLEFYGHLSRVSHLSHKDRGIDLIPSIKIGAAHYIHNTERQELHSEIVAENARRIVKNPELVFAKLSINKPVFTKDEIAIALNDALSEVRNLEGKVIGNIDYEADINEARLAADILSKNEESATKSKEGGVEKNADKLEAVSENQKIASEFMTAYLRLMNSDQIELIVEEDLKGRVLYANRYRMELERQFIGTVASLNASKRHVLNISEAALPRMSTAELALASGLSTQQKKAVIEIVNGADIVALHGLPGAGKTTVMREVVRQYQKAGKQVLGFATSENAAQNLSVAAGIEAMNIDKFRKSMQERAGRKFELALRMDFFEEEQYQHDQSILTNNHILIIDEASMVELSRSHYLNLVAAKAGAKIIKLGDLNQFAPVGAGGAFKKECDMVQVSHLTEVIRQKNHEHARATSLLAGYAIDDFLTIYQQEGAILVHDDQRAAKNALTKDYVDSYLQKATALDNDALLAGKEKIITICAHTNQAVNELNQLVREQLKQAGVLKGEDIAVSLGGRNIKLAKGEQIIFGRNSKKLQVLNGEIGLISKIKQLGETGEAIITVKVNKADGSNNIVTIDSREQYSYSAINYGYAVTAYKLQGATVDENYIYYEPNLGYEGTNVMFTRHRHIVKMYGVKEQLEDVVYSRLGEDSELARKLHNITSDQPLWRIGLSLSMHKRSNLSLASDYLNIGLTPQDRILKAYIEARSDFSQTIREISDWQERKAKIAGVKPARWQHQSWQKMLEYKDQRDSKAQDICNNYADYRDRITQFALNYQTIRKHAGLAENFSVEKLVRHNMLADEHYGNLIRSLGKLRELGELEIDHLAIKTNNQQITESFLALTEDIQERTIDSENLEALIGDISEKRYILEDNINHIERFNNKLFPEYLSRIFKNPASEILTNWQSLVEKSGINAACNQVKNNPKMLGELRGIGLGNIIGFSSNRIDAIANLNNIDLKFKDYHHGSAELPELKSLLANDQELVTEQQLIAEYRQLSRLLPNNSEQKLLARIAPLITDSEPVDRRNHYRLLQELASSDFVQDELLALTTIEEKMAEQNLVTKNLVTEASLTRTTRENNINTVLVSNPNKRRPRNRKSNNVLDNNFKFNNRVVSKKNDGNELAANTLITRSAISFEGVKQILTGNDYQHLFNLYAEKINSEGVIRQQGTNMTCGSLAMSLHTGLWMRHSTGAKGDIFHFVAQATGKNKQEALERISEELGFTNEDGKLVRQDGKIMADSYLSNNSNIQQSVEGWVGMKLVPSSAPEFNAEQYLPYMLKSNNLVNVHPYRNANNQLIGYSVRLVDKESGKKQVLPVSYCQHSDLVDGRLQQWRLKGFTDELGLKPIYGAEKLVDHSTPVLIVEGEKSADAAQRILPEYQVISWLGGCKAAGNVNWQVLKDYQIVIWPDNDQAGFAAAHIIKDKVGELASSWMIVDPRVLAVGAKWDLADARESEIKIIRAALINKDHPESIKIIDQQIKAINHQGIGNEQLVSLLETAVINQLTAEGKNSEIYLTRVAEELKIIRQTGFTEDFAIAANIARFCENLEIPTGSGRGSAVSSLVAYGLDIHKVDPIEHGLLFERFLTEKTNSNPDFDFDIAASKKILVENYLLAKYDNAAKLSVIGNKERAMTLHPAGIGIAPQQLKAQLPYNLIQNKYWQDQPLITIDHKQAESLGVKKFDLLSSKIVESIDRAEKLIAIEQVLSKENILNTDTHSDNNNIKPAIAWQAIGFNDRKTFDLIKSGNNEGVYQLASEFAQIISKQVKLEKFEDLVNLVALIRPSTKSYVKYFAENASSNDKSLPEFSDPKEIFKDTNGVVLFQEQIMQAAEKYLGVEKNQTNQFRKDLETGDNTNPLIEKGYFSKIAMENGLSQKDATSLHDLMQEFSKFGYNKSHAVAYAQVTFKTAYLKAHHPEIFKVAFATKLETKQEIVKDQVPEPEKSFEQIYQQYELQQVNKVIQDFNNQKVATNSLYQLMGFLKQQQNYLLLLPDNLKYAHGDKDLMLSIMQAAGQQKNNIIDQLHRAAIHAMDHKIMSGLEVKQFLLSSDNLEKLQKDLKQSCEDHHIAYLNQNLQKIRTEREITIGEKKFSSQEDYLRHEIAHPAHSFSDTARISKRFEQQKMVMQKQKELEHSIGGPSIGM